MLVRRIAVFLFVALAAARTAGAGIDKESQKWLEDVTAIILPEEAKIYGQLKDRTERIEFEKIFWARRDPEPGTAENEFQKTFLTRKVQADERFKRPGLAGSATGCGRMLILMGEPDSIRKATPTSTNIKSPCGCRRSGRTRTAGTSGSGGEKARSRWTEVAL
jgi:GWxTD domain-containing protein